MKFEHSSSRMLAVLGMVLLQSSALLPPLAAQDDIPLLRPEEKAVIDKQELELTKAIAPALTEAAESTVRIWEKRRLKPGSYLAYGTVVGDGSQVLTKWSEIRNTEPGSLLIQSAEGEAMPARIASVYADQDLAVLKFEGEPLKPVKWVEEAPALGSFMAATQPNGQLAGFGVLSVAERSLKDSDKAFLGVIGDLGFAGPGVKVRDVSEGSGAAKAGILREDIILQVGERKISGLMELRNALLPIEPGDEVTLKIQRGESVEDIAVVLGNRPEFPNLVGPRLHQMERMGTRVSSVRDSFTNVIQTDMSLQPNQMGGPVVNLKGEVMGVSMARADRTRSFVMSASAIREMLEADGEDPMVAIAELREEMRQQQASRLQARPPQGARPPLNPQQLEGHLQQMRRLLQLMDREMEALER